MLVAHDPKEDLYAMFGLMIEDDDGNVLCEEVWCNDTGDAKWEELETQDGRVICGFSVNNYASDSELTGVCF